MEAPLTKKNLVALIECLLHKLKEDYITPEELLARLASVRLDKPSNWQ